MHYERAALLSGVWRGDVGQESKEKIGKSVEGMAFYLEGKTPLSANDLSLKDRLSSHLFTQLSQHKCRAFLSLHVLSHLTMVSRESSVRGCTWDGSVSFPTHPRRFFRE
jgi:hypothetical protein